MDSAAHSTNVCRRNGGTGGASGPRICAAAFGHRRDTGVCLELIS